MAMKVPVTMQDRKKSYFKYYEQEIYVGEPERYSEITDEPLDNSLALHIDRRNDLFLPGDLPAEIGWWMMDDGTAATANQTFFPDVDGEIFDWWFAWHPIDRLRYACWDNEDHYDVYLEDPARALDMIFSNRERTWGSVHYAWEDMGTGTPSLNILHFEKPSDMGFNENMIDTTACSTIICINGVAVGYDEVPDIKAVTVHFLRPCQGGSMLRTRSWIGWEIVDGHAKKCIPDGLSIPREMPLNFLYHSIKELSNLARILPSLYEEEKDHWEKN